MYENNAATQTLPELLDQQIQIGGGSQFSRSDCTSTLDASQKQGKSQARLQMEQLLRKLREVNGNIARLRMACGQFHNHINRIGAIQEISL